MPFPVYILDTFGRRSEQFILREIKAVQRRIPDLRIIALKKTLHEENAGAAKLAGKVVYACDFAAGQVLAGVLRTVIRHPLRFLQQSVVALVRGGPRLWRCDRWHRLKTLAIAAAISGQLPEMGHVHAHFAFVAADVACSIAGLTGCKWSVSVHAWDVFTQPKSLLQCRLQNSDRVFCCTRHAVDYLASFREVKTELLYHGIPLAEFPPRTGIPAGPPVIVAAGRLVAKKGYDLLIAACAQLRTEHPRLTCVIYGDGPLCAELTAQINELGLNNVVSLPGALPPAEMTAAYARATIFVQPSRVLADGDRDGLPNVLLEAMASGVPIVATNVGGIPEAVVDGRTGWLVAPESPRALTAAIAEVLGNPQLAATRAAAARQEIEARFESGKTVAGLVAYLDRG
jgi:glycosyltransferase involved in cell wall biosynthesis